MRQARLHWLLVLLLLFTQEAGIAHLTLHATERRDDRQTTSHSDGSFCAKCSQYSANGAGLAPNTLVVQSTRVAVERLVAPAIVQGWRRSFVAYRGRAPPYLL
jgi:hypothetical protein